MEKRSTLRGRLIVAEAEGPSKAVPSSRNWDTPGWKLRLPSRLFLLGLIKSFRNNSNSASADLRPGGVNCVTRSAVVTPDRLRTHRRRYLRLDKSTVLDISNCRCTRARWHPDTSIFLLAVAGFRSGCVRQGSQTCLPLRRTKTRSTPTEQICSTPKQVGMTGRNGWRNGLGLLRTF